jgi:PAS domain S-box-containing protein
MSLSGFDQQSVRISRTEEFFHKIYQQVATGIAITDWQGIFQECNPAYCDVVGYSENELRTIDFASLVHPEDREANLVQTRRLKLGEIPSFDIENRYVHKNGKAVWVHKFVSVLHDEEGEPTHLIALVTNITERKIAEQGLRESEQRLRLAAQVARMYAYDWDVTTDLVKRSSEHFKILGLTEPLRFPHQQFVDRIHPDDRPKFLAAIAGLTPESPTGEVTYRLLASDGSLVWLRSNGRGFFDVEGRMLRVIGMVADVTAQKLAEEALRVSEERRRLAQQAARIATFERNVRTGCITWAEGLDPLYGLPPGSLDGKTPEFIRDLIHPADRQRVAQLIQQALKTGQPTEGEWRVIWPDGNVHWIAGRWQALMDDSGEPLRVVGVNLDITERKLAEEALSSISRRLIEAHEQERTWIAREMHDDINQRLSVVAMELDRQAHNLEAPADELRWSMAEVYKQISELSSDIHSMSHRLHSLKLDSLGLAAAAKSFCGELAQRQHVEVQFTSERVPRKLPEAISLCLFRVLQEALQNAVKHSGAKQFRVSLVGSMTEIQLTICDEGRGFDVKQVWTGSGLGLTSMKERLKLVGGELSFDTQLQRGTTVLARVPLRPSSRAASATTQVSQSI